MKRSFRNSWLLIVALVGAILSVPDSFARADGVAPVDSSSTAESTLLPCVDPLTGRTVLRFAKRISAEGLADTTWQPDSTRHGIALEEVAQQLVSDGAGGSYVAWVDYRTIFGDIYLQRINDQGEIADGWPYGGFAVCRAELSQYNVGLAPDGSGGVFVVWQDFRSGQSADLYLQRITSSGGLAEGWPEDGRLIAEGDADQLQPSIAADGSGGALVAWQDRRDGVLRVYALGVDGTGSPRFGWLSSGLRIEGAEGTSGAPSVSSSASGSVLVVWRSEDNLGAERILARRLTTGSPPDTLTSPAVVAAGGSGERFSDPAVLADSSGYVVSWTARGPSSASVNAQRLGAEGSLAPQWAQAAAATGVGAGFFAPTLVSDGSSGAFVVWEDFRGEQGSDVYAQRITAAGGPGWAENGVAVSDEAIDEYAPVATADGAGGLVVTWVTSDSLSVAGLLSARRAEPGRSLRVREAKATPGKARLAWQSFEPLVGALAIERRVQPENWQSLGAVTVQDSGYIRHVDQAAPEGARVEYRVVLRRSNAAVFFAPVELLIPVAPAVLTLKWARYDASARTLDLSFSLPRGADPQYEIIDVQGRRVRRESLAGLEPGEHRVSVNLPSRMASGMYFFRLSQGSQMRVVKLPVVR
jgi:hypothetical protein